MQSVQVQQQLTWRRLKVGAAHAETFSPISSAHSVRLHTMLGACMSGHVRLNMQAGMHVCLHAT